MRASVSDDSPCISASKPNPPAFSDVKENFTPKEQTYSKEIKTVFQTIESTADTIELPENVPEQNCDLAKVFLKVHANLLPVLIYGIKVTMYLSL
jgi:hypothetical protein